MGFVACPGMKYTVTAFGAAGLPIVETTTRESSVGAARSMWATTERGAADVVGGAAVVAAGAAGVGADATVGVLAGADDPPKNPLKLVPPC